MKRALAEASAHVTADASLEQVLRYALQVLTSESCKE